MGEIILNVNTKYLPPEFQFLGGGPITRGAGGSYTQPGDDTTVKISIQWTAAGFTSIDSNYQGCPSFTPYIEADVESWVKTRDLDQLAQLFVALYPLGCSKLVL